MSNRFATLNLLRSGLAAGALITASAVANAQATLLPELLVVSPSLTPIDASKVGSSVTAMSGELFFTMPLGKPGKAERSLDPRVRRPASTSHPSDARGVHSGRLPQR